MKQITHNKIQIVPKLLLLVLMVVLLSFFGKLTKAAQTDEVQSNRDFNHLSTGFPLTGMHASAECTSCHIAGLFKGTPRNCSGCHTKGKRIVATYMSLNHIDTNEQCEVCHSNSITFMGVRYSHSKAQAGQCVKCHNGQKALGKPSSHNTGMKATESCDVCHRTSAFHPASYSHASATPGQCVTCHDGQRTTGKPSDHNSGMRATASCDVCHRTTAWRPTSFSHSSVTSGQCSTCHSASSSYPTGRPANHTGKKATLACDVCHRTTAWLPAGFSHATVTQGTCATCHNDSYATGRPANHTGTMATLSCDVCHRTTAWTPATYNHAGVAAGSCATCHGISARGKGVNHVRISLPCDQCHSTVAGTPAFYRHVGNIAGLCGTCHNGRNAKGKNAISLHIPSTGNNCDFCHTSTTTFAAWGMNHSGITYCNACHDARSPAYSGIRTRRTIGAHKGSSAGHDCVSCHNKGISWDE